MRPKTFRRFLRAFTKSSSQIGHTILQQMGGGGKIAAMLGVKKFILLPNGVKFQWPNKQRTRGNLVEILLDPDDTYTMNFYNASGSGAKLVKEYKMVYADQLKKIFETQTGWFLSLR